MKQIINDRFDLVTLPDTAVVRDSAGDVYERRGGLWCGYECAPLNDHQLAKRLPIIVLDNGHFKGRVSAAGAALAQTAVVDGPMDPEDVARIALEAADAWEHEEFGGGDTITLFHTKDDSEGHLQSYIHDAFLEDTDENDLVHLSPFEIADKVWEVIEERKVPE